DLKIFARLLALAVMMFWCVVSVRAAQQQTPKPPRKHVQATAGAVHAHPTTHPGGQMGMMRPKPARRVPLQAVKRPVEAPRLVQAPAVPSAAALAAQNPVLPETGHGRDPFAALIRASDPSDSHTALPPGIAGLQVATMRLEGMVRTSDGLVAVVANPQDSVYFLHDGDHVFDGVVEKIGIDDITFRQESKDAFGRTVDRDVAKRLYPIAGDEQ
ncbi:MAG: hypothetical protein WA020_16290, partial [Candidatus Acidiferrales bacterium]